MSDTLSKNRQGRYSLSDGTYFTTGDDIEIKIDYNYWVKTEVKHNHQNYYLKDYPELNMVGLTARKP
ncbi:DUF5348 domain-containing protein [Viridibacillus arvi]|uniref:DUF5348 domain-containing protein n=1 Tax=Viridibacillus arvi TaxID=263475 RepID=UPI0034CEFB9E